MNHGLTKLAKNFFGFGDGAHLVKIIFPFVQRRNRPSSLENCLNYPKFQHDISPDDLLCGLRLYSLLNKSYPHAELEIEFANGLSYLPTNHHRILIGGPPTNQFITNSTRNCPIFFDENPEIRTFHYPEKDKRYEIKLDNTSDGNILVEDYCLLSKRTIGQRVELVIGGLRSYGQEGAYYFLDEPAFYQRLATTVTADNFQVLVKVSIKGTSVIGWDIAESLVMPSLEPTTPSFDAFLCHAPEDEKVVNRLASRLIRKGLKVWTYARQIHAGDSKLLKIQEGMANSTYLIVCVSKQLNASNFARLEYFTLLTQELTDRELRIIPVAIDDCDENDIPVWLRNKYMIRPRLNGEFEDLVQRLRGVF